MGCKKREGAERWLVVAVEGRGVGCGVHDDDDGGDCRSDAHMLPTSPDRHATDSMPATDPNAAEVFFRINASRGAGDPPTVNALLRRLQARATPTLLLWGRNDPWITLNRAERMQVCVRVCGGCCCCVLPAVVGAAAVVCVVLKEEGTRGSPHDCRKARGKANPEQPAPSSRQNWQALYPGAQLVTLDAAHCPHDDAPRETSEAMLKWLEALPRAAL